MTPGAMRECPKCGGCNIAGPTYRAPGIMGPEALEYRCSRCGYVQASPTLDAPKNWTPPPPKNA